MFVYYIQWRKKDKQREHGEVNAKLVVHFWEIYLDTIQKTPLNLQLMEIVKILNKAEEKEEEPKRTKDAVTKNK